MFHNQFGRHCNVECGLVCFTKREGDFYGQPHIKPIPLVSVVINACVVHTVAHVELTQTYVNRESIPIEAVYYFPVDSNGSVTNFHVEIDGRNIRGVVKAAEEAEAQYQKAVKANKTAFLVEQNKPDIFKIRVGFLKPGSEAKITIGYVTEVKNERDSNAMRFFIPTTIAPRYIPRTETDEKSKDLADMSFSTSSPAPLAIRMIVYIQGEFKYVESPTHEVKIQRFEAVPAKKNWSKVAVELTGITTDMDRDFVLLFEPAEKHIPRLYCEKVDGGSVAVMTHFIPSFKLHDQKVELYFLLDRSGSMIGKSISLAKKALSLFLHSMPVNCFFNVIGFGSTYRVLFPSSSEYNEHNLAMASSHAMTLNADLGGTEILGPLKHIYNGNPIPGILRQIFVLTDGEVSNTEQIIGLVKRNAHNTRVFALGIGDSASHHLVEGIAKAGGGTSAFVTYNESPNAKVLSQLKNALQPSLTDVTIRWEGVKDFPVPRSPVVINKQPTLMGYGKPLELPQEEEHSFEQSFRQAPLNIPPIFDGSQMVILGLFSEEIPTGATISAVTPDGPLSLSISMDEENNIGSTGMLHKLAAVKIIRDLEVDITSLVEHENPTDFKETKEKLKNQIVAISRKHQVGSIYTSFVAVDESDQTNVEENWVMESRNVPNQISHGHSGLLGHGHGFTLFGANSTQQSSSFSFGSTQSPQQQQSNIFGSPCSGSVQLRTAGSSGSVTFGGYGHLASVRNSNTQNVQLPQQPSSFSFEAAPSTLHTFFGPPSASLFGQPMPQVTFDSNAVLKNNNDENKLDNMEDRLVAFVNLQSFNGSFKLDQNLSIFLQKSLDSLKEEATKNHWDEDAWATSLAIMYFIEKFRNHQDSWELIVNKAKLWLTKNHAAQAELLLKAAQCLITT